MITSGNYSVTTPAYSYVRDLTDCQMPSTGQEDGHNQGLVLSPLFLNHQTLATVTAEQNGATSKRAQAHSIMMLITEHYVRCDYTEFLSAAAVPVMSCSSDDSSQERHQRTATGHGAGLVRQTEPWPRLST